MYILNRQGQHEHAQNALFVGCLSTSPRWSLKWSVRITT